MRALAELRDWAGQPAYASLADSIGALRAKRGDTRGRPGKVTVYDCFRSGRKRIDPALFADLVATLGVPQQARPTWWRAYREAVGASGEPRISLVQRSAELPPPRAKLVGRDQVLADLELRGPGTVSVIVGLPGVGKTELALQVTNRWRHQLGPAAVAMGLNLRGYDQDLGPMAPGAVVSRLLAALGAAGAQVERLDQAAKAALLRKMVGNRPVVLLLDDAGSAAQVAPLLPVAPRWRLVVTSRRRLPGLVQAAGAPILIGGLTDSSALELLAGGADPQRILAEPQAATRIARRCGNIALDLTLVSAAIASKPDWSMADLATRFAEFPVDQFMRPALDVSYFALTEPVRRTLRYVALLPGPQISAAHLRAAVGLSEPVVEAQLRQLADEHLLMESDGEYAIHDLVRAFALHRLTDEEPRSAQATAMAAFAGSLLADARAHSRTGRPDSFWLERWQPVALSFAASASKWGLCVELGELAALYTEFLDVSGRLEEAEELLRLALAEDEVGNRAQLHRKLGRVLELRGDLAGAAQQLSAALDERDVDYGRTLNGVGNVLKRMGRYRQSLTFYRRAALSASERGEALALGRALGNFADTVRVLGHPLIATAIFAAAQQCAENAGDEVNLAILRSNRSLLVEDRGELDLATRMAREDIADFDAYGFTALSIGARLLLTRCLLARGDLDGAEVALAEATERAEAAGLPEQSFRLQIARGKLLAAEGDADAARNELFEVVAQAQDLGLAPQAIEAYRELAGLALATGDYDGVAAANTGVVELAVAAGIEVESWR